MYHSLFSQSSKATCTLLLQWQIYQSINGDVPMIYSIWNCAQDGT